MAIPIRAFFENREFKVGSISFDLILNENHSMSNEITEHDVEDGSVITDHIKNNLQSGSLVGLVTNFTISFGNDAILANRAQDAFDAMERLWKERTLLTIITVLKVYENVAITNVSVARSEASGEANAFSVSFRQMNIVKLKTTQIDAKINLKTMKTDQNRQSSKKTEIGTTKPRTSGVSGSF